MCMNVHTRTYVCMNVHTHTYVCMNVHTRTYVCMNVHTRMCACMPEGVCVRVTAHERLHILHHITQTYSLQGQNLMN